MKKYILRKAITEGSPQVPEGTVFTWDGKLGKYTFMLGGKKYETPANEVEGNEEFFAKPPAETPDLKKGVQPIKKVDIFDGYTSGEKELIIGFLKKVINENI